MENKTKAPEKDSSELYNIVRELEHHERWYFSGKTKRQYKNDYLKSKSTSLSSVPPSSKCSQK